MTNLRGDESNVTNNDHDEYTCDESPWNQDTSAIDFGPDRLIPLAGQVPKVRHNGLDCSIELKF